jgi:endonuclease/exonuclease/phosphatase family metal-dependent hydrolase
MMHQAIKCLIRNLAPRLFGAFFLAIGSIASCQGKPETPRWTKDTGEQPPPKSTPAADLPPTRAVAEAVIAQPQIAVPHPALPLDDAKSQLRFITYNLENWLTMERHPEHSPLKSAPKPELEKKAAIQLLKLHHPDVLGVCEIGTPADLLELQQRLKNSGLDLPHSYYTGGGDPTRHLALLSRFPITTTAKPAQSDYQLDGKIFLINRGILDATVAANGKIYRFLGVHLKSKRDVEQADQEVIRLNEAKLLRRHIETIFKAEPAARLIVYGDFNDTRATPAIKTITGKYGGPDYLTAIPAKDSHGEAWTHYWALQDLYSRIDFVMVSAALKPEVDFHGSRILDDASWNEASDHRALLALFH